MIDSDCYIFIAQREKVPSDNLEAKVKNLRMEQKAVLMKMIGELGKQEKEFVDNGMKRP